MPYGLSFVYFIHVIALDKSFEINVAFALLYSTLGAGDLGFDFLAV